MPFPYIAVLLAAVLTLLTKIPVAIAMVKEGGGRYDNNHPRDQQARLTGWGRRALGAHANGFEAFSFFAAGAIISVVSGADPQWAACLCWGFLGLRILYTVLYLSDHAPIRSLVWFAATACSGSLMVLKLIAG